MSPLSEPKANVERFGVALCLYSTDPTWDKEVERIQQSTKPSTGASGSVVDTIDGHEDSFVDHLGASTRIYWYRFRSVKCGCTPGQWSPWVKTTPTRVPPGDVPCPPVTRTDPAKLDSVSGSVIDEGSTGDDVYRASWLPGRTVDANKHKLTIDYLDGSSVVQTSTVGDPVTTTSTGHTESGAGGDAGSAHSIRFRLRDLDNNTIDLREFNTVSIAVSGTTGSGSTKVQPFK